MFTKDIFLIITSFLTFRDSIYYSLSCKELYKYKKSNHFWIIAGLRDYPIYKINNEDDYKDSIPFYIDEDKLQILIKKDKWASKQLLNLKYNRNNLLDHRIEAYVKSIMKWTCIIDKYRNLYEKYNKIMPLDWRITINWMINQILNITEIEEKELQLIINE